MKIPYKEFPRPEPMAAFPHERSVWWPMLQVRLSKGHGPPTMRFEAAVDSGSPYCYFHGSIGEAVGLNVERGIRGKLGGAVEGKTIPVYFHDIKVHVAGEILKVTAGFCFGLSVSGILGRNGFFDKFAVTFHQYAIPPILEIVKPQTNLALH